VRDKAFAIDPPPDPSASAPETGQQALAKSRELQTRTETFRAMYNNLLQRNYAQTSDRFTSAAAR